MSGASERATRLIEGGVEVIDTGEIPKIIEFLAAHGTNRAVDKQIRQRVDVDERWKALTPEQAIELANTHLGMVVLLGCHRNGYVREAVVQLATAYTHCPGVVSMLAQRTVDQVPPIREAAQAAIAELLSSDAIGEDGGEMPAIITRATQGVISAAESVEFCPALVLRSLELFATRTGKYRKDRGRDHHVRTLRDLDRRSQMLSHLRNSAESYEDPLSQQASAALIEFYEHSLAGTPRG